MRDFLASRVVDGRQQIRTAITFHEDGRLVMWPYGYTYTNIPADMTADDHNAMVSIGRRMAATNGYRPEQASDLYISSGTTRDYEYGMYRIFSYTFEMSIGAYMDDSKIASETGRNKEAVLYLMERAWCPLSVLGATVRQARCGAFDDDFEVARGWAIDPDGTDTAPASGRFARGTPAQTTYNGAKQLHKVPVRRPRAGDRASAACSPSAGRPRRSDDRRARDPSSCRPPRASGWPSATSSPTTPGPPRPTSSRRSSSEMTDRRSTSSRGPARSADVDGAWRTARSRSMPSPARRSGSGSRPPTAARRTSSRSRSTTSG